MLMITLYAEQKIEPTFKRITQRAFLVVQWLGPCASNTRGPVQSLVREVDARATTKSLHTTTKDFTHCNKDQRYHMLQLRPGVAKKINTF